MQTCVCFELVFFVLEILRTRVLTVSCVRRVVLRGEGNIQRKFVAGWRL